MPPHPPPPVLTIQLCYIHFGLFFFWPFPQKILTPSYFIWSFDCFKFFLVFTYPHQNRSCSCSQWHRGMAEPPPHFSRRISRRGAEPLGWAPNCFIVPLWSQPRVQRGQHLQWHSHLFHRALSQDRLLISQESSSCCQRLTNGGQHWTDLPLSSWSQGKELHLSRAH